jgi:hypothetical protein
MRHDVQRKRKEKEHHAYGKNCPEFDRTGRRIPETYLDNVSSHSFDWNHRIQSESWLLARRNGDNHRFAERS